MISLIAAIGKNNELGKGNELLWKMPADMKHFVETTSLHAVVMGRKTFESIGRPLPRRRNIVITRDANYKKSGVEVANSLAAALDKFPDPKEEIFIIGGAELYRQTIEVADRLYITHVDAEFPGADAFFPEIIPIVWNEVRREEHKKDSENPFDYAFSVYDRFV